MQVVRIGTDAHSCDLARGGESNSVHQTGASIQLEHPGFRPPRGLGHVLGRGHAHVLDLGLGLGLDRDAPWTAA